MDAGDKIERIAGTFLPFLSSTPPHKRETTPTITRPAISPNLLLHLPHRHRSPTARYPPLIQLLLQPRDLLQALSVADERLHALLLGGGEFRAVGFAAGGGTGGCGGAVERRGDVEGAGFDAGYLWLD